MRRSDRETLPGIPVLAANVGGPKRPGSRTVSVVDVGKRALGASIPVPGRTRWTVFDAH